MAFVVLGSQLVELMLIGSCAQTLSAQDIDFINIAVNVVMNTCTANDKCPSQRLIYTVQLILHVSLNFAN